MNTEASLRELGVPPDAGADEIERAYKSRSRALKSLILGARRVDLKEQRQEELRRLVVCRAAAQGKPPPKDWHKERFPISSTQVMRRLDGVAVHELSRKSARSFLGVGAKAKRKRVLDVYRQQGRALVKRLARATDDNELRAIRRARGKLRTVRNFAL